MKKLPIAVALLALAASAPAMEKPGDAPPPHHRVLIELFTSQG
jgi:hypothetical protein